VKLSSLYRLCDVEWKADHEGEVLEETTMTYYEVSPSNLTCLGEITDRSIAVSTPDTRNQADNQIDNPWMIPKIPVTNAEYPNMVFIVIMSYS